MAVARYSACVANGAGGGTSAYPTAASCRRRGAGRRDTGTAPRPRPRRRVRGRRRCRPRRRRTGRHPWSGSGPAPCRAMTRSTPSTRTSGRAARRERPAGSGPASVRGRPEREAGIDHLGRQAVDRVDTALDDLLEPDLLDESLPRFDALEGAALEQVRRARCVRHRAARRRTQARRTSGPARGGTALPQPSSSSSGRMHDTNDPEL